MNYKNYNDYELIYMVRENDESSKDILMEKYLPILKNISMEYYSKYNNCNYDYDDFLQEAIISFQRAILTYDENKKALFYTFVIVCVRRNMITFCRNISNEFNVVSLDNIEDYNEFLIEDKRYNTNLLFNERLLEKIYYDMLLELDIKYSSILELRINGFSYREISVLLDIPHSTVEYRMRKIKNKLNIILNN